jgi:hypothetical protein
MIKKILLVIILFKGALLDAFAEENTTSLFKVEKQLNIAAVPAAFPVRFCLLSTREKQYVAYYDKQHRMTVASRPLDSDKWQYQVLDTKVGWDSHNYITMAVDNDGDLHVSGNMHCVPLIYFRTETPADISTLKKFSMTGKKETRCTYPKFIRDADNRLIFHYRHGGSGNGSEIYNVYDLKLKTWKRLLDKPLVDGQGKMNAYMGGPLRGPNGWFHMHWVWRDTPDCATNHHLSYARSKDLLNWESVFGDQIELPIKFANKSLWVDPIPSGGGIINGGHKLFFDSEQRPIITYHKSDSNGNMQIYAARPEAGKWKTYLLTDWKKPVIFSGNGSKGFIGIRISELKQAELGSLTMTYRHSDYGNGRLVIDEKTLSPTERQIVDVPDYPKQLNQVESNFNGMKIQRAHDIGSSDNKAVRYILQWETLGPNGDRPRMPPLPQPSNLKLYKFLLNTEIETSDKTPKLTP